MELGNGSDRGARTVGSCWSRIGSAATVDGCLSSSDAAVFSHKAAARIAKSIRSWRLTQWLLSFRIAVVYFRRVRSPPCEQASMYDSSRTAAWCRALDPA